LTRVSKHVIQSDFRRQCELIIPDFGIDNRPLSLIDRSNDISLEFNRSDNLDSHDGFHDDWFGFGECFPESTDSGESEGKLVGVLDVGGSVF
jgi:hypothetical protein